MNRREKILGGALAGVVLAFAGDLWLVEPGLAWYRSVQAQTQAAGEKIADAQLLIDHRKQITGDWYARHGAGLLDDENAARFRAQGVLNAAANTSGLTLESVSGGQRTPALAGQSYDLLRLTLSGQGSLAQVQNFLAAIHQAGLPLRVERCEMAARDGRKDQIDLALTLSLRMATQQARAKITLPKGVVAWLPAVRSDALDANVLKARPFLTDRHAPEVFKPKAAPVNNPAVALLPGSDWMLVGLVERDGVGEAFVTCASDGSERLLHAGDSVAQGQVKSVDADGLRMRYGSEERLIQPGFNLAGTQGAQASPAGSNPGATATKVAPASTSSAPAPAPAPAGSDADREAILQRLREKRNRTSP